MESVITVRETARLLGMSPQGVREHIKLGHFKDFAMAVPNLSGTGYRYLIFEEKLKERMGVYESN